MTFNMFLESESRQRISLRERQPSFTSLRITDSEIARLIKFLLPIIEFHVAKEREYHIYYMQMIIITNDDSNNKCNYMVFTQ